MDFGRGGYRYVAFERSANMGRNSRLSFIREDVYAPVRERIQLGMTIGLCQLSKLYAYNGLMLTSGTRIEDLRHGRPIPAGGNEKRRHPSHDGQHPDEAHYERLREKHALRAWCSIPDRKNARPRREGQSETDYRALHGAFPELVDEDGAGWYYRHVHQVVAFVRKHPDKVLKSAVTSCDLLKKGFDEAWRDKLRQMQVPIFSPSTKADWPLRFDDIVADAMEEGPLRGEPVPLSAGELERLRAFTPKGIPETVLPALVQFYRMNKPEDGDWVVLPVANFDAYFGTTAFGRKWLAALPETVIRRSESSYGVSRYRVEMILI